MLRDDTKAALLSPGLANKCMIEDYTSLMPCPCIVPSDAACAMLNSHILLNLKLSSTLGIVCSCHAPLAGEYRRSWIERQGCCFWWQAPRRYSPFSHTLDDLWLPLLHVNQRYVCSLKAGPFFFLPQYVIWSIFALTKIPRIVIRATRAA